MRAYEVIPPKGVYGWHVVGPSGKVVNTFGPGENGEAHAVERADELNAAYVEGFAAGQRNGFSIVGGVAR